MCIRLALPKFLSVSWCLLKFYISYRVSFCATARGLGAYTPYRLLAQAPSPVVLVHAFAIQATPPHSANLPALSNAIEYFG